MLQKLILLFALSITLPLQAAPFCGQVFQKAELRPAIGVFVESGDGRTHLLLDSYFSGSHEALLRNFHNSEKGPIHKLLWAGEAMIQRQSDKSLKLVSANETSGFLHSLKTDSSLSFLKNVDYSEASVLQLRRADPLIETDRAYLIQFDPKSFRIVDLGRLDGLTARHEIGNHFTIANAIIGMKMRNSSFKIPKESFESFKLLREFVELTITHSLHQMSAEKRRLSLDFVHQTQEILSAKNELGWSREKLHEFRNLSIELHRLIYKVDAPILLSERQ